MKLFKKMGKSGEVFNLKSSAAFMLNLRCLLIEDQQSEFIFACFLLYLCLIIDSFLL